VYHVVHFWKAPPFREGLITVSFARIIHHTVPMSKTKTTGKARRGRPASADPRVSCHVPLSRSERAACNLAAQAMGLGFAPWARLVLLARIHRENTTIDNVAS
jgi:hypothetical protein